MAHHERDGIGYLNQNTSPLHRISGMALGLASTKMAMDSCVVKTTIMVRVVVNAVFGGRIICFKGSFEKMDGAVLGWCQNVFGTVYAMYHQHSVARFL